MKKKCFSFVMAIAILLCLCSTVSASWDPYLLQDRADLLSDAQEQQATQILREVSEAYSVPVAVMTLSHTPQADPDRYGETCLDELVRLLSDGEGGILLLVCMDLREFKFYTNGVADDALSDWDIEQISDAISPLLSDEDYVEAFEVYAEHCREALNDYYHFNVGDHLLIACIIGLVIGLITVFVMKGQLKSVRQQNQANAYIRTGSFQLTGQSDLFLYRTVSRVKKASNQSSGSRGSSGGSRSRGGGRF